MSKVTSSFIKRLNICDNQDKISKNRDQLVKNKVKLMALNRTINTITSTYNINKNQKLQNLNDYC